METKLSSLTQEVVIGYAHPTVLIGERINPAGKKKLAAAIKTGDLELIRQEAIAQVASGANVIDINVSVTGVDEAAVLPLVVALVASAVEVPICIDTHNPKALISALEIYRGKPLINSVSGETHSLETILPLVKKYGAAVIALPQNDAGVPETAAERIKIAQFIIERAMAIGIPIEDIIVDSLAMTVGAVPEAGVITLETIRGVKASIGANQTLGASNISFGMPDRHLLNDAFLATAITAGVTCPIVDAAKTRPIILATDVLLNRDSRSRRYIQEFKARQLKQ
jgi:5-methyltetrahydrofolate--homocysteine methyltransferase